MGLECDLIDAANAQAKVSRGCRKVSPGHLTVVGRMHALRDLGQKALQDENNEGVCQGKVEFHSVQVQILSDSARMTLSSCKEIRSSRDL
jgi:hypothetical protein